MYLGHGLRPAGATQVVPVGADVGIGPLRAAPGVPVGAGLCPRPMCRPVDGSRAEACPGGHIGPPLRGGGGVWEPTKIGAEQGPRGAGRSPPPTGGWSRAIYGGVWSPRPTERSGELPRVPGQRSERGKSSWSNPVFAQQVSCAARRTGFGSLMKAPPVFP